MDCVDKYYVYEDHKLIGIHEDPHEAMKQIKIKVEEFRKEPDLEKHTLWGEWIDPNAWPSLYHGSFFFVARVYQTMNYGTEVNKRIERGCCYRYLVKKTREQVYEKNDSDGQHT